jgi:hypothetical protein
MERFVAACAVTACTAVAASIISSDAKRHDASIPAPITTSTQYLTTAGADAPSTPRLQRWSGNVEVKPNQNQQGFVSSDACLER